MRHSEGMFRSRIFYGNRLPSSELERTEEGGRSSDGKLRLSLLDVLREPLEAFEQTFSGCCTAKGEPGSHRTAVTTTACTYLG